MIYFVSDYSQGGHPEVMQALMDSNLDHADGYGLDAHCERAAAMVKELIGVEDCSVYMMPGGTPCNVTTIAAALRPYESVVAPRTGHIYMHETGAVEATGHRVVGLDNVNGKLTPGLIDEAWEQFQDEHTVLPRMVYITQPTEGGSVYSLAEMQAISDYCRRKDMLLYIDGARLATALTCDACDFDIADIAPLCDAFYLGGTKNGALFGEALVILNKDIDDHFRFMIKRSDALFAKGRLIGVQFEALLTGGRDSLWYRIGRYENRLAGRLNKAVRELGTELYCDSRTNQIFPVLPEEVVVELEKKYFFERWAPGRQGMIPVRFVIGWGSREEEVEALIADLRALLAK